MFTDAERSILRALAQKQLEAAHSSKNLERVAHWKRRNALKGEREVLHIEINNGKVNDIIIEHLRVTRKIPINTSA